MDVAERVMVLFFCFAVFVFYEFICGFRVLFFYIVGGVWGMWGVVVKHGG
jgi:hypothetical protein